MTDTIEALDAEIAALFSEAFAFTARALSKLAEFDRRNAWAALGFQSCAHWLNFRIGISLGAAREHVRVARALEDLPRTSARFSAGTLSYSKVRALTRIATGDSDEELAEMAGHMTASQVEKVVRGISHVGADQAQQQLQSRGVTMGFDDDGMFFMRVRLMPDEGARLMQTIDRLAPDDRARSIDQRRADAIMALGSEKSQTKVVVHVGPEDDCRIETSRRERVSVSAETGRRLACDATVVDATVVDATVVDATVVDAPVVDASVDATAVDAHIRKRRSRNIPAGTRRALAERDHGCQYPGCANTIVDAHHVEHWRDGGESTLANLVALCRWHHGQIHEGGYRMVRAADGALTFFDTRGDVVRLPQPLPAASVSTEPRLSTPWHGVDWTWRDLDLGRTVASVADQRHDRSDAQRV